LLQVLRGLFDLVSQLNNFIIFFVQFIIQPIPQNLNSRSSLISKLLSYSLIDIFSKDIVLNLWLQYCLKPCRQKAECFEADLQSSSRVSFFFSSGIICFVYTDLSVSFHDFFPNALQSFFASAFAKEKYKELL
jgi:hypothetical protein